MKRLLTACAAILLGLLASARLEAQPADAAAREFPNRPVRIVVPAPAGGPTDIIGRLFAQKLSEIWGQPVIIENRAGANTVIGAQFVARSVADGYSLLIALDDTLVMNPLTMEAVPYDPIRSFAPITMLSRNTSVLIVRADGPATVQELIARGRANQGALNYGAGITTTRLAGFLFTVRAGFTATAVPYRGSAEVLQGLLNGSIDFAVDGVSSALPLITGGQLRALAKLNNRPLPSLPALQPLAVAANLPELGEIGTWMGLVAPAGTPPAIVERIRRTVEQVAADTEVTERLARSGMNVAPTSAAEFEAFLRAEIQRWSEILRASTVRSGIVEGRPQP
jgi:tripartite-type tricarboxylate transporter receptor subunit TctC